MGIDFLYGFFCFGTIIVFSCISSFIRILFCLLDVDKIKNLTKIILHLYYFIAINNNNKSLVILLLFFVLSITNHNNNNKTMEYIDLRSDTVTQPTQ